MTKKKPKEPTITERLALIDSELRGVRMELHDVNTWCYRSLGELKSRVGDVRAKFDTSAFWLGFLAGAVIGLILLVCK